MQSTAPPTAKAAEWVCRGAQAGERLGRRGLSVASTAAGQYLVDAGAAAEPNDAHELSIVLTWLVDAGANGSFCAVFAAPNAFAADDPKGSRLSAPKLHAAQAYVPHTVRRTETAALGSAEHSPPCTASAKAVCVRAQASVDACLRVGVLASARRHAHLGGERQVRHWAGLGEDEGWVG